MNKVKEVKDVAVVAEEEEEDMVDADQVVAVVVGVVAASLTLFAITMGFKDMCTVIIGLRAMVKKASHLTMTHFHRTKSIAAPLDTMNLVNERHKIALLNIGVVNVGDGGTITAVITLMMHPFLHPTSLYKT